MLKDANVNDDFQITDADIDIMLEYESDILAERSAIYNLESIETTVYFDE